MRPLVWWWCAANFSADWLLNLAQIFGLPFRWATYEPTAAQETVDRICTMLQNMGSAGWAAFPAGTSLELKADGQRSGVHISLGEKNDFIFRLLFSDKYVHIDTYKRGVFNGYLVFGGGFWRQSNAG